MKFLFFNFLIRPDLYIYSKNLLDDNTYDIQDNLFDKGFFAPIEYVKFDEYKIDVDIRTQEAARFTFDYGSTRTLMNDFGVGQFRQKFDFSQFPFDEQTLKIKILTDTQSTSDTSINWPKGNASVFFVSPDIGAFIGLEKYKQKNILKELGWSIISTNILSDVIMKKIILIHILIKLMIDMKILLI